MIIDLLLRWIHIVSGVLLLGGVFLTRLAWLPAMKDVADETRDVIQEAVRARWAKVVMATSLLLLVSGLINAVSAIIRYEFVGGTYHMLVGAKLLLALAIMWLSAKLAGRSDSAKEFRKDGEKWANLNVALAIVLLVVANVMKLSDRTPKPDEASDTSTAAVSEVISDRG